MIILTMCAAGHILHIGVRDGILLGDDAGACVGDHFVRIPVDNKNRCIHAVYTADRGFIGMTWDTINGFQ